MDREIAEEIEMLRKARIGQHLPAIAADREHAPGLDQVMAVQLEDTLAPGKRALVPHRLPVILALAFQAGQLEQAMPWSDRRPPVHSD